MQGGVLAYYFLRTAEQALTESQLEDRVEQWLKATFAVEIEFEVAEALAKLDRFGLLCRDGERLSVPPPEETIARLDRLWGDFFRYQKAPPPPRSQRRAGVRGVNP